MDDACLVGSRPAFVFASIDFPAYGPAYGLGVSPDDVPVDSDASQPKSSTWSAPSDGSIGLEALPEAAAR